MLGICSGLFSAFICFYGREICVAWLKYDSKTMLMRYNKNILSFQHGDDDKNYRTDITELTRLMVIE